MPRLYKHVCSSVNKSVCLPADKNACSLQCMKYGERLKLAREHAKLTQTGLAKRLAGLMTQQAISHIEKSDASGSEFSVQIAIACGVRSEWLAMESGDMTANGNKVQQPSATYEVRDPILDDLAALEPEDADVWRAQIRAAAIKARKAIPQEESDRSAIRVGDPPSSGRRIA